jgi:hypothetical protein
MASTIYDLKEAMDRLLAMEKEAVPGSGGVTYWPYSQDKLPYWMNRLNPMTVDTAYSSDVVLDRYSVSALLVIDHFDAGYEGKKFEDAYETYIPDVLNFFDDNPELTSTDYPTPMRYIAPVEDTRGAHITGLPSGTRLVLNSGIGVRQVVLEFTIEVPLWRKQY